MILCRIHKKMYIISLGKKGNFDKDEAKVPRLLKIDVFSELSPDFGHRLSLFFINVTFKYFQYTLVIFVTYFFILTKRKDFFFYYKYSVCYNWVLILSYWLFHLYPPYWERQPSGIVRDMSTRWSLKSQSRWWPVYKMFNIYK